MLNGDKIMEVRSFDGVTPQLRCDFQQGGSCLVSLKKVRQDEGDFSLAYEIVGSRISDGMVDKTGEGYRDLDSYEGVRFSKLTIQKLIDVHSESVVKINQAYYAVMGLLPSDDLIRKMNRSSRDDEAVIYVPSDKLIVPALEFSRKFYADRM